MKISYTRILLLVAILYIGWSSFFREAPQPIPDDVVVVIPEVKGTTGIVDIEPTIVRDTVYLKGDVVEVDKGYKELYERAKDSLEKKDLYLESIRIRKYADTILNNDEIMIKGEATTRGSLLNYSVDYTLKEKAVVYTPEVIKTLPRLTGGVGLELGVPTEPNTSFIIKANVSLMNNKGNEVNLGYDTEQRVWIGLRRNIRIIK